MKKNSPVLKGFILQGRTLDNQQILVWCPYCQRFHIHGWSIKENPKGKPEHRYSHCGSDKMPHYYVKPFTLTELKKIQKDVRLK